MDTEEVCANVSLRTLRRKKVNLERRDENGDILPIWNCPACGAEVDVVYKEECTSLDIYKECLNCGYTFKEVWVIERVEEVKG